MIRVLIVDDAPAVRRGIRLRLSRLTDITVIGEASSGPAAVLLARAERADVVLMDIQMPGGSGLTATRALAGPGVIDPIAVIVITNHADDAYLFEALDAGAAGFLLKMGDPADLTSAVRAAARGEALVSSRVTAAVLREFARRRPEPGHTVSAASVSELTPAEFEVVEQLTRGLSNERIAEALHLSVNTVRSHLSRVARKTGLEHRTQIALWAVKRGVEPSDQ